MTWNDKARNRKRTTKLTGRRQMAYCLAFQREQLKQAEYQLSLHRYGERASDALMQRVAKLRQIIKNYEVMIQHYK